MCAGLLRVNHKCSYVNMTCYTNKDFPPANTAGDSTTSLQVGEVVKTENGLTVKLVAHTDLGKAVDIEGVSTLLWAIGRNANMDNLGIETTKVELDRGFIKVDEYQNTSVQNLYALGDIAGKKLLTPGE